MAAGVGIPYVLSPSSGLSPLGIRSSDKTQEAAATDGDPSKAAAPPAVVSTVTGAGGIPLEGAGVQDLARVFRFDVTTSWVLEHWSRVSTGLAEMEKQGYRVALVSGTRPDDVAGSLTYYFGPDQHVERITFYGSTGDARRLVAVLATQHGFLRVLTDDPGLFMYQVKEHGKPISELRIRASRVVRAEAPNSRFEVALIMQRPHPAEGLLGLLD